MKLILLLGLLTTPQADANPAQSDSLTLEWAYEASAEHFARAGDVPILERARDLRLEILDTGFLPRVSATGQAVYHSEVASISLPGASLPSVPHDQYRAGFAIDQLVYDGGGIAARKAVERASTRVRAEEVAIATYALRAQVESAYFGVLLAEAQAASLATLREDLSARLGQMEARIRRGVATESNADVLRVEIVRIDQRLAVAESQRMAFVEVLGELTGRPLPVDVVLSRSVTARVGTGRPELALFDRQKELLSRQSELIAKRTRPVVASFGEAAVGRPPGLNLFEDSLTPFFSVGIRVSWPFWDWRASERERQVVSAQDQLVDRRAEAFLQSVRAVEARALREIEQAEIMLASDDEIIALRARIAAEASSRLDNGVITATDYIAERNAEHQARLARRQHHIQLQLARARHKTITG